LLQLLNIVRVLHIGNLKVFLLHLLDPLHSLSLRINIQYPSETLGDEATIFSGEFISG
jgi:hypothetical protein